MNEFINSRSMLTPGVAGALVMVLANSLTSAFNWGISASGLALSLSFSIGMVVLGDDKLKWFFRVPLYVLNSLIIFSMAFGSNTFGKHLEGDTATPQTIEPRIRPIGFLGQPPFKFVQTQQVINTPTPAKAQQDALKKQIVTLSNSLQLIQQNIIANQKKISDPNHRMDKLVQINKNLINLNQSVEADGNIDAKKFELYQKAIDEIQNSSKVLQDAILKDQSNTIKQKRFFKDWN